jgi:hypothetical protein
MTDEHRQFLKTVLDALKEGDGNPVLVYADWLEDNDLSCPEFFRLLGRHVRKEETEWAVVRDKALNLSGGHWNAGTSANPYIRKTLHTVVNVAKRDVVAGWVGVSPYLAGLMAYSMEISQYPARHVTMQDASPRQRYGYNMWGLPPVLYGFNFFVFEAGTIPDRWAVVVDERAKILGVVEECVP